VIAFIANLTSEEHRPTAMAMVGGSIGVSFAVAIVGAPIVFHWLRMSGLVTLVGIFSILAIGLVLWVVPDAPKPVHVRAPFAEVLHNVELLRPRRRPRCSSSCRRIEPTGKASTITSTNFVTTALGADN
jgi:MFS family permease